MEVIDVTLNPNDMGSGNTLSNGNLTVTGATTTGIRATHGKTTGKWYWEVKLDAGDTRFVVGSSNKSLTLSGFNTSYLNTNWRGFNFLNGNRLPENTSYGVPSIVGNIIGIALDLDNGTLELYRNGVSMGVSHTNIKELGEVYPTSGRTSGFSTTATFNFGLTSFIYEIPKKFYSYDGRQYGGSNKILISLGDKGVVLNRKYTDSLIPIMTSNTAPSGTASASDETLTPAFRAFDGVATSNRYWAPNAKTFGWVAYDFNTPTIVARYDLTVILSNPTFAPKSWTFEGSNDGVNWTVLDTQNNQSTWINDTPNIYNLKKISLYQKYRLNMTSNNGASTVGVGEMRMYGIKHLSMRCFQNISEKTYVNYGMDELENLTVNVGEIKENTNTNVAIGSGKTFEHVIDMSKRRVDKITLG
ncbi:hypothetical protein BK129_03095 [Paenibacillus amylolyticus]|uniref:SPRY domain-containing protein n=1 Tax=Paenibacillus amylolyticus TaxID=1451 RepID=UPI00096C17C1|nr:SPRY domain-containing protein [Paenibacillus amylolyticus]OMF09838.1 hypothetical protein BK129_03095 [Paenibacillus amylolyticus]